MGFDYLSVGHTALAPARTNGLLRVPALDGVDCPSPWTVNGSVGSDRVWPAIADVPMQMGPNRIRATSACTVEHLRKELVARGCDRCSLNHQPRQRNRALLELRLPTKSVKGDEA
ncbi:hypothetical protein MSEO_26010 [Mycobacterium seoulense]|uniref:Uncharacterized protein n=1 Tax=Mycobacterium seoulense TaxID=386911 RepID=A0A7I7P230_9MYCO|nr:hypothetical protein MSEO_26010 [Mycobacterium seoulense]